MVGIVAAVSRSGTYTFSKPNADGIRLMAGLGVDGDIHAGTTVKHRARLERDPTAPNLRQIHLIHAELHDELAAAGFPVAPGEMGENLTTRGIDLLALGTGTRLRLGGMAVVEVTGLRNPCRQLNGLHEGLLGMVLGRDDNGAVVYRAGVMGVVLSSGDVRPGDRILAELPAGPYRPLVPV